QGRGQAVEYLRPMDEGLKSGCYDNPLRMQGVAVVEGEPEPGEHRFNFAYRVAVSRQSDLLMKPVAVPYEVPYGHWIRQAMAPAHRAIHIQGQAFLRIGDVGRHPRRPQEHARGHMALPERHRFAEELDVQARRLSQVRECGETVRPGADNGHGHFFHRMDSSFERGRSLWCAQCAASAWRPPSREGGGGRQGATSHRASTKRLYPPRSRTARS